MNRLSSKVRYGTVYLIVCTYVMYGSLDIHKTYKPELHGFERKTKSISFLKIPKTGSSTVSCIFLRFGIRNNLRIFLPRYVVVNDSEQNYLLQQKERFDIFAIHTRYSNYFFTNIVPNAVIIGLVRDPVQRILSQIFFSEALKNLRNRMNLSQQEFVNEVAKNTSKYGIQNVMADFFRMDSPILLKHLDKLNSEFLLVLTLEQINESLVLLKRLLNWSFADIIYGERKVNKHEQIFLNDSQILHLQSTDKLDFQIYAFFSRELNKKIEHEGEGFRDEVLFYEQILNEAYHFCTKTSRYKSKHYFPASRWEDTFPIFKNDCELIFKQDVGNIKRIYSKI